MTETKYFHVLDIYSAYSGDPVCLLNLPMAPNGSPARDRKDNVQGIREILQFQTQSKDDSSIGVSPAHIAARKDLRRQFEFVSEIESCLFSENMRTAERTAQLVQWQEEVVAEHGPWHSVETLDDTTLGLIRQQSSEITKQKDLSTFTMRSILHSLHIPAPRYQPNF